MPYQSVNPATGEVLQKFEERTDAQMMKALAAADATYRESWSIAPYKERAEYIGKAAALMLEQKEALARIATLEMGKRIAESRGEVKRKRTYTNNPKTTAKTAMLMAITRKDR